MINIAICDDELIICSIIEGYLLQYAQRSFIKLKTEVFVSGEELIKYIKNGSYFDLIFLDIEMGERNGVETGRIIREELNLDRIEIAYVSAHHEYAMDLFQMAPIDFLIKPIKRDDVIRVLEKTIRLLNVKEDMLICKMGREEEKVLYQDILYFESDGRKIFLHTYSRVLEFNGTLSKLYDDELKKYHFLYCHRSYIVNYYHVRKFSFSQLILSNDAIIPIAKIRRKEIKELQERFEKEDL